MMSRANRFRITDEGTSIAYSRSAKVPLREPNSRDPSQKAPPATAQPQAEVGVHLVARENLTLLLQDRVDSCLADGAAHLFDLVP